MINFASNLNKMINAGLGGPLDPPRTEVAVGHRVIYTEVSGDVVNFETNVVAPVKNLRVTMEPVQDLHGYDHPWPAGGGKNKLNKSAIPSAKTTIQYFPLYVGDGIFTMSSNAPYLSGNAMLFFLAGNVTSGASTNTNGVSPTTGRTQTAVDGYVTIGYRSLEGIDPLTYDMQIESGSTPSAWSPYENICPITGRDAVTVYRSGADMSDPQSVTVQLGQTVYGGTLDVTTGKITVTHGEIASYNGEVLTGEWISDRDVYAAGTTPTIGAQVVYVLDTPQTIDLDPQQITTLEGTNNVWSDAGDISLEYPYYEETEGY